MVKGFLGDIARLYWAAVYWNLRKTFFRLGRTRGQCPCQHHSDSGLAGETACIAIVHWHDPAKFRRVCPLLQQRPDKLWRCSVNAAEVRPFWLRAVRLYAGTLLVFLLIAVLATFGLMRGIGYKISLRQIIWPPAWSEVARVRSLYFVEKADQAAVDGNIRESLLSLYNAYELDPGNYPIGLRLAQLWQVNQTEMSDNIYQRLMRDHPDYRSETARLWLRALLARGDFNSIQHLAGDRLVNEIPNNPAWLHALIFAARQLNDFTVLDKVSQADGLPDETKSSLNLVAQLQSMSTGEQRKRLIQIILQETPDAYTTFYVGRQLLRLGYADEALALTLRPDAQLAARERILLRLDSLAALRRDADRTSVFLQVLQNKPNDTTIELLCTHLIRYPDAVLAHYLFAATAPDNTPAPLGYETRLSLFCVAGVLSDATQLEACSENLRALSGGGFKTLDGVQRFFLKNTNGGQIEAILPILQPLPLEITYALLDHKPAP